MAVVPPGLSGGGAGYRKSWLKIAKLGDLPDDVTPHVLRHSFASLAGDLGFSEATIAILIGHKGHSITSRYVLTLDAVLLAAEDAVADKTMKLMEQPNLKSEPDQAQPRLVSDRHRWCGTESPHYRGFRDTSGNGDVRHHSYDQVETQAATCSIPDLEVAGGVDFG
ncbi:MAG: hypothetical protein ABSC06_34175 [Rhodopila sp.]